jgi:nicotinate-nucleotide pyrophosphorylase (carboxylating)
MQNVQQMPPRISSEDWPALRSLISQALREDIGEGDATTIALIPQDARGQGAIITRHTCRIAGLEIAREVFRQLAPELRVETPCNDGDEVPPGEIIMSLNGPLRPILTGERTALNFMQRLCGIATLTATFVEKTRGRPVRILDTRKTTPTLRCLEKHAVLCGGGVNHRFGLFDMILIKDNHRRFRSGSAGLADAIRDARRQYPNLPLEVEVESEEELREALTACPDWILLDNMSPAQMRRCAEITAGRCKLEASGGITLATIEEVAATGVDAVSLGCLTHSAPAADLTLELQ